MEFSWGTFTGGTILGILITCFLSHVFAKDRSKQDRKTVRHNQIVSDFRTAFNDALINLNYQENTVALILKQTFTDHKVAYIKFRDTLPERRKLEFEKIWSQYEDYYNSKSKNAIFTLFASTKTDYEAQEREKVSKLIKSLLDYAKEV